MTWNPRFSAYGENHMRWVEDPEACGLRRVGSVSDVLEHIRHAGWYLDHDCHETVSGCVYRMSARDGVNRFVAGYDDPWNDGPACLSFDEIFDCEREAARRADQIAERMAEAEREHEIRSANEMRAEEIPDEIRAELETAMELRRDLTVLPSHLHRAADAIRMTIADCRETAAKLREELETLRADPLHGFAG